MKQLLALFDEEIEYSTRLTRIINEISSIPYDVSPYSGIDTLMKDLFSGKIACLMISASILYSMNEDLINNILYYNPIILDDGANNDISRDQFSFIWKYQSGITIRNELLNILSQRGTSTPAYSNTSRHRNCQILCLYSPVDRHLVSSLCVLLSSHLSKDSDLRIVNIDLSHCSSFEDFESVKYDITDLMYHMENTSDTSHLLNMRLESMLYTKDNVSFLKPSTNPLDLQDIKEDSWVSLINAICNSGSFDYMILGLSDCLQGFLSIMDRSFINYIIGLNDSYSKYIIKQFYSFLSESDINLDNFKSKFFNSQYDLPSRIDELLSSPFADYCRPLVEEIIHELR